MSRPTPEAEQLKAHGNAMYQRGKYGAAIDAYTEAITLCPRWLPLVLNRALCHRKRKNWAAVKEDCVKALDIDRESIKANYMFGLSLIAERRFTEAVGRLNKALENARASEATMQDEIWRELARAKYLEWELGAAERAARVDAVETKLRQLGWDAARGDGDGDAPRDASPGTGMDVDGDDVVDLTADYPSSPRRAGPRDRRLTLEDHETIDAMFRAIRSRDDRAEDPPDCFCCKLTFEVFRDPVSAPSGHSYERLAVLEHLRKVGKFDPVTREPMTEADLRPNLGLRNAAHEWLNAHAWAYADIIKPDAPLGGED